MCLILLAHKIHPQFPLIVAANRDEFHIRPTLAAAFQEENPDLLMGKDLEAGGTWLGVNKNGFFSAVTNAGIINPDPLYSRGNLPLEYLKEPTDPLTYATKKHHQGGGYQGFNLLVGNVDEIYFATNKGDEINQLSPGIHGLANGGLDDNCFRINRGKSLLKALLPKITAEGLFKILADRTPSPEMTEGENLPERQKKLPCFIAGQEYGTRASTILLINQKGQAEFIEQAWFSGGKQAPDRQRFFFQINGYE